MPTATTSTDSQTWTRNYEHSMVDCCFCCFHP